MQIKVYDREKKQCYNEVQYRQASLRFLYNTVLGRFLLHVFFARPIYSKWEGYLAKQKSSVKKIAPFVAQHHIDLSECEETTYDSFHSFFTRKIMPSNRAIAMDPQDFISPADGKLSFAHIDPSCQLKIKNSVYTVSSLLRDKKIAQQFQGGLCVVLRLTVDDYHRYCFIDGGTIRKQKTIPGFLHTVRPISRGIYKVYSENHRVLTMMDTRHLGTVAQLEVGALLVGKIHNHATDHFYKGQEKGYFELGGSTIILLIPKNKVTLHADIQRCAQHGIEVKVKMGEKIGVINND